MEQIRYGIEQVARNRGIRSTVEILNADAPARAGQEVLSAIQSACQDLKLGCKPMVSRAYHDSLFMSRICPMSMIFIPCKDGISHRPDEFAHAEDICKGVEMLALTLARLSRE